MSDIPTRDQLESHTVMQKVRCLDAKLDKAIEAGTVGIIYKAGEGINITDDDIIENADHDNLIAVQASVATKQNHLTTAQLNACNSGITSTKVSAYDAYASGKQDKLTTAQLNACNSGITSAKVSTYDGYSTGKQDKLTAGTGITISNNVISATGGSGSSTGYWEKVNSYINFVNGDILMIGVSPAYEVSGASSWQTAPSDIIADLDSVGSTNMVGLRYITVQMCHTGSTNIIGSDVVPLVQAGNYVSSSLTAMVEISGTVRYDTVLKELTIHLFGYAINGAGVADYDASVDLTPSYAVIYKLVQ